MNSSRLLGLAGAVLTLAGLLTGGLLSGAMTGTVPADAHLVLAAHLSALMGAFWIISVAWSLPYLRYGHVGARRLAWAVIVPQYLNWSITLLKSFWGVHGVYFSGSARNRLVFAMLTLGVVIPSLLAASAWVYGFLAPPKV